MSAWLFVDAATAQTGEFQYFAFDMEIECLGEVIDEGCQAWVVNLGGSATSAADSEFGVVFFVFAVASDKRVERFNAVSQAALDE